MIEKDTHSINHYWLGRGYGGEVQLAGSQNLIETIHHEYLHYSGFTSHEEAPLKWGNRVKKDLESWIKK